MREADSKIEALQIEGDTVLRLSEVLRFRPEIGEREQEQQAHLRLENEKENISFLQ